MKHFMLIALLASLLGTTSAFAVETTTECPMMAQARKNAKANLDKTKSTKKRKVLGRRAKTV